MEELRGDFPAQVACAIEISPFAIELSALSLEELAPLDDYLGSAPALPFRYLSIHGPSKKINVDDAELAGRLLKLAPAVDAIVMHPDTMASPGAYRPLGRKLLIENMDARKAWGRTRPELEVTFKHLPEAGFCFDIAHAWSVDSTMESAADLLDGFSKRLRHIHLSSLSADLHHVPLTEGHEQLFEPILGRCIDVPWILEAPPRAI